MLRDWSACKRYPATLRVGARTLSRARIGRRQRREQRNNAGCVWWCASGVWGHLRRRASNTQVHRTRALCTNTQYTTHKNPHVEHRARRGAATASRQQRAHEIIIRLIQRNKRSHQTVFRSDVVAQTRHSRARRHLCGCGCVWFKCGAPVSVMIVIVVRHIIVVSLLWGRLRGHRVQKQVTIEQACC